MAAPSDFDDTAETPAMTAVQAKSDAAAGERAVIRPVTAVASARLRATASGRHREYKSPNQSKPGASKSTQDSVPQHRPTSKVDRRRPPTKATTGRTVGVPTGPGRISRSAATTDSCSCARRRWCQRRCRHQRSARRARFDHQKHRLPASTASVRRISQMAKSDSSHYQTAPDFQ